MQIQSCTIQADMIRMAQAIEQDIAIQIRELHEESAEMYARARAACKKDAFQAIDRDFHQQVLCLERHQAKTEGMLRNSIKKRIQAAKVERIDRLFHLAETRIQALSPECRTIKNHLAQCLSRMDLESIAKQKQVLVVFCEEFQRPAAEMFLQAESIAKDSFQVLPLPKQALGGTILCIANGQQICDNSYHARLSNIRKNHIHTVSKMLSKLNVRLS